MEICEHSDHFIYFSVLYSSKVFCMLLSSCKYFIEFWVFFWFFFPEIVADYHCSLLWILIILEYSGLLMRQGLRFLDDILSRLEYITVHPMFYWYFKEIHHNFFFGVIWKLFSYITPNLSFPLVLPIDYFQHLFDLLWTHFLFVFLVVIFRNDFLETANWNEFGVKTCTETTVAYFKENTGLDLCDIVSICLIHFTNKAKVVFSLTLQETFSMLLRREIDETPMLQESMYSHYSTNIPW